MKYEKTKLNQGYVDKILIDLDKLNLPRKGYRDYDYIKLVFLWSLFETWMDTQGNFRNITDALVNFRKNENSFSSIYSSVVTKNDFEGLYNIAKATKVYICSADDLNKSRKERSFIEPKNIAGDMIALIYEIRNKIVHGDWQIDWSNENLTEKECIMIFCRMFERWIRTANANKIFL